jgi:hypothetical protein
MLHFATPANLHVKLSLAHLQLLLQLRNQFSLNSQRLLLRFDRLKVRASDFILMHNILLQPFQLRPNLNYLLLLVTDYIDATLNLHVHLLLQILIV